MRIKPNTLSQDAIAPFGTLLEAERDGFQSLVKVEEKVGWQLALNKIVDTKATTLHRHPNTREGFALIEGNAVILLAPPHDRSAIQAFHLTQPVCLFPNVWHTTFSPQGNALVMICENAQVDGEMAELRESIEV